MDQLNYNYNVSLNYIEVIFKKLTGFDGKQKLPSLSLKFFQTVVLVLMKFKNYILIVFVLIVIYRHDRKHDSIWLKCDLILKIFYRI